MITILPSEIIEYMLTLCAPRDVASFAQTCRIAHLLIYKSSDSHLWRQLFLAVPFDDLRSSPNVASEHSLDWKSELKDRVAAELTLAGQDISENVRDSALDVVLRTIHHAPAGPMPSKNIAWAERVLNPHLTVASGSPSQTCARLLAYMGLSQFDPLDPVLTTRDLRSQSRAYVYNLRHYTPESNFGVFRSQMVINSIRLYEPNWVHVQYCVNVIIMNVLDLESPEQVFPPRGLEATRAYSAPESDSRDVNDWAGVEGVWRRYVCFMDYRDLHSESP